MFSQKLNLRLNDYPIHLGKTLNVSELRAHGIKKEGFWGRLLLKHAKGEKIFWSKPGTLKFFDHAGEHSIIPNNRNVSPSDQYVDTSAFFHYTDGVLTRFAFQMMKNPNMAEKILKLVEERIIDLVGKASFSEGPIKSWTVGNEKLVFHYPATQPNGHLHFFLDQ